MLTHIVPPTVAVTVKRGVQRFDGLDDGRIIDVRSTATEFPANAISRRSIYAHNARDRPLLVPQSMVPLPPLAYHLAGD
jgi:hypothetical protein